MRTFLHAGSGKKTYREIPISLAPPEWKEVRFDIDRETVPDIVGSITDMSGIQNSSFDAVFTSHTIEHLYPNDVRKALQEFFRVLKSDGFLIITCPDLVSISKLIVDGKLLEHAYTSPEGPVTALDMLYGFRPDIARGNTYMAHKTGFTLSVLCQSLREIGFVSVAGKARPSDFDLWAIATKNAVDSETLQKMENRYFPE